MKTMIVLGGVAALALSGAAIAQTNDGQRGGRMDPDARLSQAEFVEQRVARLTAMDANGDGVVSREEMQAHRQARMGEMRGRMFERMDTNSDGTVTRSEYDAAHEQRREGMTERRAERGEASERRGGRGHRGGQRAGMRLDRDGQGVNIEQARQRAVEQFAAMDANGDGYVTGAEMRAHREARRADHQARRADRRQPAE
ncbi:EF-hand domain-containing protein [Brevundimonas sp.]|uniref:EF-hand domain-containing protein n=1 Tax=Brevundimonas sp. TaxID=1871086 RepID=UPI00391A610A